MQTAPDTSIVRDLVFLVIGAIIGTVLGFIGSYLVQRSAQNRAWKREYVLKNVGEVFVPLYKEIHSYIALVLTYDLLPYNIGDSQWNAIRNDYRDLFVEGVLKNKLNNVYDSEFSGYNANFRDTCRTIANMWFKNRIKKNVEANGHSFTHGPSSETNVSGKRIHTINLEEALNYVTDLIRQYITKFIFLNEVESQDYVIQQLKNHVGFTLSEKEYLKELKLLKETVESLNEIQEFKKFRVQLLNDLNEIKNILKERIKRPYKVKL